MSDFYQKYLSFNPGRASGQRVKGKSRYGKKSLSAAITQSAKVAKSVEPPQSRAAATHRGAIGTHSGGGGNNIATRSRRPSNIDSPSTHITASNPWDILPGGHTTSFSASPGPNVGPAKTAAASTGTPRASMGRGASVVAAAKKSAGGSWPVPQSGPAPKPSMGRGAAVVASAQKSVPASPSSSASAAPTNIGGRGAAVIAAAKRGATSLPYAARVARANAGSHNTPPQAGAVSASAGPVAPDVGSTSMHQNANYGKPMVSPNPETGNSAMTSGVAFKKRPGQYVPKPARKPRPSEGMKAAAQSQRPQKNVGFNFQAAIERGFGRL